jgi:type IV secretory pathway VirB3-like protein
MDLTDRIEIPSGLVAPRTFAGVPLEAGLMVVCAVALPWIAFQSLWALLVAVPVWAFLRFHSRQDPLFLKLWAGQISFKPYYHA